MKNLAYSNLLRIQYNETVAQDEKKIFKPDWTIHAIIF